MLEYLINKGLVGVDLVVVSVRKVGFLFCKFLCDILLMNFGISEV